MENASRSSPLQTTGTLRELPQKDKEVNRGICFALLTLLSQGYLRYSTKTRSTRLLSLIGSYLHAKNKRPRSNQLQGAFHLSAVAELKELVLPGVNGKRKSTPREYARAIYAVSHVFNPKRIRNYFAPLSAVFGTQNSRAFRE